MLVTVSWVQPGRKEIKERERSRMGIRKKKLIATVGVEDLIVVEVEDVLLICKKDFAQQIKKLIKEIDKEYR